MVCGTKFVPSRMTTQCCSEKCRKRWRYLSGNASTAKAYETLSGNWERYYRRLVNKRGRSETLTVEYLMELHEQQGGKCALTGEELTCKLIYGKKQWTNASIDRIVPAKGYVRGNVQLVCAAVNMWRGNLPLSDYIKWCKMVAENNPAPKRKKQDG